MLGKSPGLTLVIVLSLAIGIGANTAIFSVVNGLLLRPLPYPDADRLANLWLRSPGLNIPQDWPSPGEYMDIRSQNHVFEELAIAQDDSGNLTGLAQPERVSVIHASSALLPMLGAKALLGRIILPEEDAPGKPDTAVLTNGFWKRRFGADPHVVGRSLTLDGKLVSVVGVLAPDFSLNREVLPTIGGVEQADLFMPLPLGADAVKNRFDENFNIMGRLKRGVSLPRAQADIDIIASRIRTLDKRDPTFTISVVPLREQVVGDVRRAVLVLLGSVTLVLLIACANVANLLLARATSREKEIAIRAALGAGKMGLIRQMLAESTLLGILGGSTGLFTAYCFLYLLRSINPGNIPRLEAIQIDGRVVAFTFAISLLTSLLFGLVPALRVSGVDLNTTLKAGGRSGQSEAGFDTGRRRLRGLLVVTELAFSLMLLIGAGLLVRSFVSLSSVGPGFNTGHVISMRVSPGGPRYRVKGATTQFYEQAGERISRLPGIEGQGATSTLPLTPSIGWGGISIEGYVPPADKPELQVDIRAATPDYFRTMAIPLHAGRFFSAHDGPDAQPVLMVDRKMAQMFWPREGPVGKRVKFGRADSKNPWMTIVGVVGTVRQYGLDIDGKMAVYLPEKQVSMGGLFMVARTAGDPAAMTSAIVNEIHTLDPEVAVYDIATMDDRLHQSLARRRFSMTMLAAFAGFALILAIIGIYGVISYLVTQATRDIGIRLALGATPGRIRGMVIRQGMGLAAAGILAGLAGAALLTRLMASLLYGTSATDILTFSVVAFLLAVVAFFASYVPAMRATKVDPLVALRYE